MDRVLIVDDDKEIVKAISIFLKNENIETIKAYNGEEAIEILEKEDIHLIIMDIMMPKLDGIKATMRIREEKNIPIIMLSAKSEDMDKILGLSVGADDYISKPFNPLELIARVKSQLRRYKNLGMYKEDVDNKIILGDLVLDKDMKELIIDGEMKKLTLTEYKIIKLLMENKGRVFSAKEIYEHVWNEPCFSKDTVMVHIQRIRGKIEKDSRNPRVLKVVWGIGYKIG
jgi:DNA-binding response OmpR family regulator